MTAKPDATTQTPGHRSLTEDERAQITAIHQAGNLFLSLLEDHGGKAGREFAIARTKIEEAQMWAVKGITR